ncbi:MAG TPA: class I SAM-dependent methyltransferase [Gemmatimonadaceae bacterium]|nr:class I SAM-dependent methyltransferase [Gemmatimonadaceae bacterium]
MQPSLLVAVILALVAGWFAHDLHLQRRRRRMRVQWPIRTVPLSDLDPVFRTNELGPTLDTEVAFVGRGPLVVPGGTSDAEAWVLATVAKKAKRIFEFGTCSGKTTYLVARNSPPDAVVTTITLAPAQAGEYVKEEGDDRRNIRAALRESKLTHFLYNGTPVEPKVRQLFGDSKAFDETPFLDSCDLIFVDGSHAYSYVMSDSRKALRMIRPGGLILWHDYVGPEEEGVFRGMNELAQTLPLVHVEGTSFVAYRRPLA